MVQPISYLQTDPKWANVNYSAPGESTTIGKSGCGPTAMAMVLATWVDKSINPKSECAWALAHGYKAPRQGTYYGYFRAAGARFGLEVEQVNFSSAYGKPNATYHSIAKQAIDRGDLVIACMGPGLWTRSGHFVLVYDIQGKTVFINDPASMRSDRTKGDYNLFRNQVKYYFIIKHPGGNKNGEVQKEEQEKGVQEVKYYETLDQIPAGEMREVVKKLIDRGTVKGTGDGLHLSEDMVRMMVYNDREGLYK